MVEQAEQSTGEGEAARKELVVTVHDEDAGGEPFKIPGEPSTKVEVIIETFYKELGSGQQEGDRLTCLANGSDVFSFAQERLSEYAHRECETLEWGFSRNTGGA